MIESLREVKRELKWLVSFLALVAILFVLLHATPKLALRTHLFFEGHPKIAFTSEFVDYKYLNLPATEKSKGYILTEPPFEKDTESVLETYQVKQTGFFYFAKYENDF